MAKLKKNGPKKCNGTLIHLVSTSLQSWLKPRIHFTGVLYFLMRIKFFNSYWSSSRVNESRKFLNILKGDSTKATD